MLPRTVTDHGAGRQLLSELQAQSFQKREADVTAMSDHPGKPVHGDWQAPEQSNKGREDRADVLGEDLCIRLVPASEGVSLQRAAESLCRRL